MLIAPRNQQFVLALVALLVAGNSCASNVPSAQNPAGAQTQLQPGPYSLGHIGILR